MINRFCVLVAACLLSPVAALADVTLLMSGGFRHAADQLVPEFEKATGIKVVITSGASQGTGSGTIEQKLKRGEKADLVILAREGFNELVAADQVRSGSAIVLGSVGLGIAVKQGGAKPDLSSIEAYKATLLQSRMIAMPGSTSGLWMVQDLFPKLGILDRIKYKVLARGTDCTDAVADGGADLTILPVSEILHARGVDYAGAVPQPAQFELAFVAATVNGSPNSTDARRLIEYLASPMAAEAVKRAGLEPPKR